MDLGQQKRGFTLLYDLFVRGASDVRQIPYLPAKTVCPPRADNYFPRATPESRGIESARVQAMLEELEHNSRVNMHAITVLCDGAVIAEASVHPYDRQIPHVSHSLCKSVVGIAIGILHGEGRISLDESAYRYFDRAKLPARLSTRMKAVTVRHLLTMTSGVAFGETGSATESDWVRAFFSADVKAEPGSEFAYNSMNSYILAAIVCEVTGMGLVDYLRPRLFEPLMIRNIFWETCPMGIERGGWGLYIAQEDVAKLAQMLLDGGVFAGRRILDAEWVRTATTAQAITPADSGDYHYGFQMWCAREGSGYLFNGMLGQNAWVSEKNRIIVVTNAGNLEFFQKSAMLSIIEKYLGGDFVRVPVLRENRRALRRLRHTERESLDSRAWVTPIPKPGLFRRLYLALHGYSAYRLPGVCRLLSGRRFVFRKNNCGILPVFVRLTQNNHTAGLRTVSFETVGDRFFLSFDEGKDALYRIEVGFYGYAQNTLTIGGECYRLAAAGGIAVDEDGRQLLKVELCFPELSHARRMKFYFDGENGEIELQMREMPGKEVLDCILSALPIAAPKTRGLVSFLQGKVNLDYLLMKVYDKFEPKLLASEDPAALPTPVWEQIEKMPEDSKEERK
jgi:CubicO group peptidase (beta-lactamase class C family)